MRRGTIKADSGAAAEHIGDVQWTCFGIRLECIIGNAVRTDGQILPGDHAILIVDLYAMSGAQPQRNFAIYDEGLDLIVKPEGFYFESEFGFIGGQTLRFFLFSAK